MHAQPNGWSSGKAAAAAGRTTMAAMPCKAMHGQSQEWGQQQGSAHLARQQFGTKAQLPGLESREHGHCKGLTVTGRWSALMAEQ